MINIVKKQTQSWKRYYDFIFWWECSDAGFWAVFQTSCSTNAEATQYSDGDQANWYDDIEIDIWKKK